MFFNYNKWAMLWALFILVLCGIPGRSIPHSSFLELLNFDKFVHASLFFVLITLTVRGFLLQLTYPLLQKYAKVIGGVVCIIYGGALEIMQGAVFEQRSADLLDFIANSFGVCMGILFYGLVERKVLISLIRR